MLCRCWLVMTRRATVPMTVVAPEGGFPSRYGHLVTGRIVNSVSLADGYRRGLDGLWRFRSGLLWWLFSPPPL